MSKVIKNCPKASIYMITVNIMIDNPNLNKNSTLRIKHDRKSSFSTGWSSKHKQTPSFRSSIIDFFPIASLFVFKRHQMTIIDPVKTRMGKSSCSFGWQKCACKMHFANLLDCNWNVSDSIWTDATPGQQGRLARARAQILCSADQF